MYKILIIFILITTVWAQEEGEVCFKNYVAPYVQNLNYGCSFYNYISDEAVVTDLIARGNIPVDVQVKLRACQSDVVDYYHKHYIKHSEPIVGMKIYLKKLRSRFDGLSLYVLKDEHDSTEWIALFEDDAKGFILEYSKRYPNAIKRLEQLKKMAICSVSVVILLEQLLRKNSLIGSVYK